MPRGRHYRKRKLSKKRTIRSSKSGSGDKSNTLDSGPVSNGISRADYDALRHFNWSDDKGGDTHTTVLASHARARELVELLKGNHYGVVIDERVRKLLAVIDARFAELQAAKAAAKRVRSRTEDVNQTSLFDASGEKHD